MTYRRRFWAVMAGLGVMEWALLLHFYPTPPIAWSEIVPDVLERPGRIVSVVRPCSP